MKRSLPFNIPFSGFQGTTFINCFASTFMFLENITGDDNFECKKRDGQPCDGCGNCHNTTSSLQERIFFLFDTMCGRSSLRWRFDGELTEMQKLVCEDGDTGIVEFLFDFTEYEYQKLTDPGEFQFAIAESIDADRPVVAKVRSGSNRFRVITGYDNDTVVCPDFSGAQKRPEAAPTHDDLDALHVIGRRIEPHNRHSPLENGLKRIEEVVEYNLDACLWDEYMEGFKYWGGGLEAQELEEIQRRFKRIAATMWHTFNCHNFGEAFRHCVYEEMSDPAFADSWSRIGFACDDMHTRAWSIIHLEAAIDWQKRPEWGICEIIPLIIERMKQNDIEVLEAVRRALRILHQKREAKPVLMHNRLG
jgi:hypothetical protein